MIIQNPDGSLINEPLRNWRRKGQQRYGVEVPTRLLDEQSSLIERLITFAFDTLGAASAGSAYLRRRIKIS